MKDLKILGRLLSSANLLMKKQDGQFLVYNSGRNFLSRGVLVPDLDKAELLVRQYIRSIQTNGRANSLVDFVSDQGLPYREVNNTSDPNSAYFINRTASMSLVDRLSLLQVAHSLVQRAEASASTREDSKVSPENFRRHLKLRREAQRV